MKSFSLTAALILLSFTTLSQASTIVHRNCEVDEILYNSLPEASQKAFEETLVKKGYKVGGVNNKDGLVVIAMIDTQLEETQILEDFEENSWQDRLANLKKRTEDSVRKFLVDIDNKVLDIGVYVWDTNPGYDLHSYERELASKQGIFFRKSLATDEKFINNFMNKIPKCKVQKSQL